MQLITLPIKRLRFATYNPRRISDEQLTRLRESIRTFGFTQPIIVNMQAGREYTVVGGHQRAKAASMEGLESVPATIVFLDENKEKTLNLALNRISGEWDRKKVGEMLVQLTNDDQLVRLTGFEDQEVGVLLDEQVTLSADDEERDYSNMGEKKKDDPAITQLNTLQELGPHRLYCGDPNDPQVWQELLGDARADIIFTNLLPYDSDHNREDYEQGIGEWLANMAVFSKETSPIYIIAKWADHAFLQDRIGVHINAFRLTAAIPWLRRRVATKPDKYKNHYDMISYLERKGERVYFNGGEETLDVWGSVDDRVGEFETPHWLIVKAMIASSRKGALIVDPNAGTGDTLFAGHKLRRNVFLIEKDPYKCDDIVHQWERLSP